jgi:hypothetical protein
MAPEALAWREVAVRWVNLPPPRVLHPGFVTDVHIAVDGRAYGLRRVSGFAEVLAWPDGLGPEAPASWTPTPMADVLGVAGIVGDAVVLYARNELIEVSARATRVIHRAKGLVTEAMVSPRGTRVAWTETADEGWLLSVGTFQDQGTLSDVMTIGSTVGGAAWVDESAVAWSEVALDRNSLSVRVTAIGRDTRELARTSRIISALAAAGDGSTLAIAAQGSLRRGQGRPRASEPGLWIASAPFDRFECVLNWSAQPRHLRVYPSVLITAPSVPGQDVLAAVTAAGATAATIEGPRQGLAVWPDGTRIACRTFGPNAALVEQDIEALRGERRPS